jgi:DNA-binding CsgD family transcriptional regulator
MAKVAHRFSFLRPTSHGLGLALCLIWLFCLIFSSTIYPDASNPFALRSQVLTFINFFITILLIIIGATPQRIGRLLVSRAALIAITTLTCLGIVLCVGAGYLPIQLTSLLILSGTALISLGSVFFLAAWGIAFTRLESKARVTGTAQAFFVAIAFFPCAIFIDPVVVQLALTPLPVISFILLNKQRIRSQLPKFIRGFKTSDVIFGEKLLPPLTSLLRLGLAGGLLVVLELIMPFSHFSTSSDAGSTVTYALIWWGATFVLALIVALSSIPGKRLNFSFVYRGIIFLIVCGSALSFLENLSAQDLYAVTTVANLSFHALWWIALANFAADHRASPVMVFGIGEGLFQLFTMLGELLLHTLSSPYLLTTPETNVILVISVCLCLVVFTFMLSEKEVDRVINGATSQPPVRYGTKNFEECCRLIAARYKLSKRQTDVFVLSARGYSQQRIQQELFLAPGTVNAHAMSIYHKLGVHSQQELIALTERECGELEKGSK